jgi:hypothetical protein
MVAASVRGLLNGKGTDVCESRSHVALPYADLGAPSEGQTSRRSDIILITGRFRSGSTLLWNLFRNIPECTAYYEPLNERRWFDAGVRGQQTDATHRNVSEYWKEYDGLQELGFYYREEWTRLHLFMDENFWDPGLKRYVELLIERAPDRPVLQFNRIDFRLAWFRRNFPGAKMVHLYRHPRDQWCSTLMDVTSFPRDGRVEQFAAHDKFYLLSWANDLKYHFPFLEPASADHPYQLFYYLWKLSYLFGRRYAHYSLAFEDLVSDPAGKLAELFDLLGVRSADLAQLMKLLVAPELGKWKQYADDAWFRDHETICETTLADFFAAGRVGRPAHAAERPDKATYARSANSAAQLQAS